jgi:hypothetical protein
MRLGPFTAILIAVVTIVLMDFLHDEVQSAWIRPLVAGAIAGCLTAGVLIIKRIRGKHGITQKANPLADKKSEEHMMS